MSNDLLVLHSVQVPDCTDTVQLGDRKHVGLVRAPVKTGDGGIVWADSAA